MSARGSRLVTERLELIMPPPAMAARVAAYHRANREHHAPWSPTRSDMFFTETWWRQRLALARSEREADSGLRFVLVLGNDPTGPVIGECNFSNFVRGAFQACHLGYSIGREHEGKGYMTEALRATIAHVFGELDLHRVMANYRPENERSARLLARLGFVQEGIARDYLFIDGAWRDHVLTSLVNASHPGPDAG